MFPYPEAHGRSVPRALAGRVRALAKSELLRKCTEPERPARSSMLLIDDEIAACSRYMSRVSLLTFAFDINGDDRIVGGLVFGSNRGELGLNERPRTVRETVSVGVTLHARAVFARH